MPMSSYEHVEMQLDVVVHINIAKMNERLTAEAKYFVVFIDEASRFVRATQMKSKGEAAKSLKEHVMWNKRQTEKFVKKIVIYEEKEFVRGLQDSKTKDIEISVTARYTPQENGTAALMIRTIKNGIQRFLFICGAPSSMGA